MEELEGKIKNILKKHKGKKRLYPKMKLISERTLQYPYVNKKWYKKLAKLTSKINFECNLKDGKCTAGRTTEMCCCCHCVSSVGHFRERFFTSYASEEKIEKELLYYAKKYSTKTGFWRKDIGCILSRKKRSSTCLTYNCKSHKSKAEKLLINVIRDCRSFPSYTPTLIKVLKQYFGR